MHAFETFYKSVGYMLTLERQMASTISFASFSLFGPVTAKLLLDVDPVQIVSEWERDRWDMCESLTWSAEQKNGSNLEITFFHWFCDVMGLARIV